MLALATLFAQMDAGNVDVPLLLVGILSIGLGILILIVPRILNYVIAVWLIVVGVLWLIAAF